MPKYILILILVISGSHASELILPENATPLENSLLTYKAQRDVSLEKVFGQWSQKAWGPRAEIVWDLGEFVNLKHITISSGIELSGSFKHVVNELLKRINKMEFTRANNMQIFTCLYNNKTLVIKTINAQEFKNGVSNEKCI